MQWQLPSMIGFTLLKSARQVSRHVMCPPKSLTPAEIKGYVWYDKNEIRAGEDWDSQIGVGLRKCSCAIFCLSPNFFDSVNCKGELKAIRRRLERKEQVQLFPVTMAECPVPDDCFYALSGDSLQRVLLTDGPGTQTWNEAIDSLVQPLQESFMAHTPPSQATPALLTRPRSFSEAHLQDMQPVTPTHGGLSSNQRKLLYLIARICGYLPPKRGPDGLGRTRSASWLRAHPLSNPDTPRRCPLTPAMTSLLIVWALCKYCHSSEPTWIQGALCPAEYLTIATRRAPRCDPPDIPGTPHHPLSCPVSHQV